MTGYNHAAFYDNEKRKRSPEIDFGVWWTDERTSWPWSRYRVTWIEETGEVYCVSAERNPLYLVFGVLPTREEVERVLDGWAEECGKANSLAWVRERVESYQP